ncbi:hypothetical protein [Streptomyces sp. V4I2]|uniref:hypothetical protein n=1 Tax=Streptomyces sp. V4I2 TaxID=3042280 RepID=UPI00277EB108|nr:hypothetical protein [Streptomyces sp. V4I2]MDQ1043336.1 hypothetical protein [Streptomyces sp. V4I2]
MQSSHAAAALSSAFDDPNLIVVPRRSARRPWGIASHDWHAFAQVTTMVDHWDRPN